VAQEELEVLASSVAAVIADYRKGEIDEPNAKHVERWVAQFDEEAKVPLLRELEHVLGKTYCSRSDVEGFLTRLISTEKLTGGDPKTFWQRTSFLNIQGGGNSQRELLEIFDEVLADELDVSLGDCGGDDSFVYVDDAIFSGGRVCSDLAKWVESDAPEHAQVHVITIASHYGSYYWKGQLEETMKESGKDIKVKWWTAVELENRKKYRDTSDVLWPTRLPDDTATRAYAESLQYPPTLRTGTSVGGLGVFSSAEGRDLLEQEFLKAGVRIREMAPNLNEYQRPLGNSVLATLGFGSTLVTYRNCPNNAPLALWVHAPWYPLFQRETN
jgi:hypothetical protein